MTICTCNNQLQPHDRMEGVCPEVREPREVHDRELEMTREDSLVEAFRARGWRIAE